MVHSTALPLELVGHPFPVMRALDAGASASRLRGPDLVRPFWGVRSVPTVDESVSAATAWRARAYLSRAHPSHVISHASAAEIWGIPLPGWPGNEPLHIAVPPTRRSPRGRGVLGHTLQLSEDDVVTSGDIRVTSQSRTLFDLATTLAAEDILAAGDYLLWRRRPESLRLTLEAIQADLERFIGRRGLRSLHEVLPLLSDRSDSPTESKLRYRMLLAGLPQPQVNPDIYDRYGNFIAMVDLVFGEYKIAVDYEGDHHRTDAIQWQKDLHRVPRLQDAGWHHTRASAADLRDSSELLARLERLLRHRGWDGTPGALPLARP